MSHKFLLVNNSHQQGRGMRLGAAFYG